MNTVAVVDYGMGNLRSVVKALEHAAPAGTRVLLTDRPADILEADRVVFPGQGAARDCMQALDQRGLSGVLRETALTRPFLGICMGMQVLMDHSEENGGTRCLGIVPGRVHWFGVDLTDARGERLKIPHMGWNRVHQVHAHPLWAGIEQDSRFYFVHSYYVEPAALQVVAGTTDYGMPFTSAIAKDHIFAIQCHPEKSAATGLTLLRNFMHWTGGV
ncbi:imidazole glycerol phosphate synthase subunit HisH [Ectothiorhodospira shaposhnikovii]|uniref:imidazole glycerol phosphate synthase subunit HisH n=1 Tax=Ectothiorhodospira shaposhnikovii TaxID=1054 RepID=UPI001EE80FD4|nr:imidazole glycerol phosphate synthase subunit HisH [Ectothiorhodospira shaposhnikovii]MCG5512398.1 imidazole glycerol phosphate synthase subunit HisH [Ectothiorhodospira shaposhnikovii]